MQLQIKEQITQAQKEQQKFRDKIRHLTKKKESLWHIEYDIRSTIPKEILKKFDDDFDTQKHADKSSAWCDKAKDLVKISSLQNILREKITKSYRNFGFATYKLDLLYNNIMQDYTFDLDNEHDFSIIEVFFKRYNNDLINNEIFDKTYLVAQKLKVKIIFISKKYHTSSGLYDDNHKIIMPPTNAPIIKVATTLLHELIHSVSVRELRAISNHKSSAKKNEKIVQNLTAKQVESLQAIKALYGKSHALHKKTCFYEYGFKNSFEFLAEIANPSFRSTLQDFGVLESLMEKYYAFLAEYGNNL